MIRQAVILAAGKGKRMRENCTDPTILSTPKHLLKIGGMPIIEHKVKALVERGVKVCIVVNPKEEALFKKALRRYPVTYCYQTEQLGTAHALYCAKDFVKEDRFLVLMGDDFTHDIKRLELDEPAVFGFMVNDVTGYGVPLVGDETGGGVPIVDGIGIVKRIAEKELTGCGIANSGIYIMPSAFFSIYKLIPKNPSNGEYYLTDAVKILSEDEGIPFKLRLLESWVGINTRQELSRAKMLLDKRYKIARKPAEQVKVQA